jgi:hypothetical protein
MQREGEALRPHPVGAVHRVLDPRLVEVAEGKAVQPDDRETCGREPIADAPRGVGVSDLACGPGREPEAERQGFARAERFAHPGKARRELAQRRVEVRPGQHVRAIRDHRPAASTRARITPSPRIGSVVRSGCHCTPT